jgi:hypothetical protein
MFGFGTKKTSAESPEERALEAVLSRLAGWSPEDSASLDDMLLRLAPNFFAEGASMRRLPVEDLVRVVWEQAKKYWMHLLPLDTLEKRWRAAWEGKKHLVADRIARLAERARQERII